MDDDKEFTKLLKSMESEVLALKTAHQRPLGVLSFFKETSSTPVTMNYIGGAYFKTIYLTVKVESASRPPIVQTGWNIPVGFLNVNLYGETTNSDYSEWTYELNITSTTIGSTEIAASVLSSQPIREISWRLV